jgi:hypothetical protein
MLEITGNRSQGIWRTRPSESTEQHSATRPISLKHAKRS